jgi:hypothetical protein
MTIVSICGVSSSINLNSNYHNSNHNNNHNNNSPSTIPLILIATAADEETSNRKNNNNLDSDQKNTNPYIGVNVRGLYTSLQSERYPSAPIPLLADYYNKSFNLISEAGMNHIRYVFYWEAYERNPELFLNELDTVANFADKWKLNVLYDNHQYHTSSWLDPKNGTGFPESLFRSNIDAHLIYRKGSGGEPKDESAQDWVDECDHFPNAEARAVRSAVESFISKPNSENMYLLMSSTANKPGGLLQTLEQENPSIYFRMVLTYEYGLEGPKPIYDLSEIERAKQLPDFQTQYECKYLGLTGNVLDSISIDRCILAGDTLAKTAPLDDWSIQTKYVMSVDIGWGSSATAIMVSRFVNGKVQIIYSCEYSRPVFQDIIDEIWRLKNKCNGNLQNILMDASATELYTTLCNEFNQNPSQKYLREKQDWCKKVNSYLENHLFICPIPFNPQAKYMLNHTQRIMQETEDDGTAMVGLHSSFGDLITACRSAYMENEKLSKERGVFADSFDALLMNLSFYRWST